MAGAGLALSVAQTLVSALLWSPNLKEICSKFGCRAQVEQLIPTVHAIRELLLDFDDRQLDLSHGDKDWIDKLKDFLYDVDDYIDELMAGGKDNISRKVRRLSPFSLNAFLDFKKFQKKLDAIAYDRSTVDFRCYPRSVRNKREETYSYVNEQKIVGRDGDKEELVAMLLNAEGVKEDVSFVTIVGIGGLGKTTLAQLVYDHDRIRSEFQLRIWVCVSQEFGVKEIFRKMLSSITHENCGELSQDQLRLGIQQHTETQRYLLVLDDVWEESPVEWKKFKGALVGGTKGSKVLVTGRSKNVARAIGNSPIYKLKGLSEDYSWQLFKSMAFHDREEHDVDASLVGIGKDIVRKCYNVPLCIKVVASLLRYDQDRWLLFQRNDLAQSQIYTDAIVAILKSSYDHLTPPLRSCFSYCAFFPKDYAIEKDKLLGLWMVNGCIVPQHEDQSIEDAAEEYFSDLFQRGFFQEITVKSGTTFCKVHGLMHDLALKVAGNELMMLSPETTHLSTKMLRHVSVPHGCSILNNAYKFSDNMKMIRTFLQIDISGDSTKESMCQSNVSTILTDCRCLRWLDLRFASWRTLPSGIDRLIHLRCLDLSENYELEILPESITNLPNLQILKLRWCEKLRALPKNFSRLVNLRHLDIDHCYALSGMPEGLKNLACLHRLTVFIVGGDSEEVQKRPLEDLKGDFEQVQMSQLEDLKALENLRGSLNVKVVKFCSSETSKVREGAYLLNKPHLKHLDIHFKGENQGDGDVEEALLEGFQPNCNLTSMAVDGYKGVKLASWMFRENAMRMLLPHLVTIRLEELPRIRHLPLLSRLCHLKDLYVSGIPNLEYMESDNTCAPSADSTFFPALEVLSLLYLPKIKGWWIDGVMADVEAHGSELDDVGRRISTGKEECGNAYGISSMLMFSCLRELNINGCPNVKSLPPCPNVEVLRLNHLNGVPSFTENRAGFDHNVVPPVFALKKLTTDNVGLMRHLPKESVRGLTDLMIHSSGGSLLAVKDVFGTCASSLQILKIQCAYDLELENEDGNGMPWESLRNLSSLTLSCLPQMVNLPIGLQCLSSLQSLSIQYCHNLTVLPKWLSCLTYLRSLNIRQCRNLTLSQGMLNLPSHIRLTFEEY